MSLLETPELCGFLSEPTVVPPHLFDVFCGFFGTHTPDILH